MLGGGASDMPRQVRAAYIHCPEAWSVCQYKLISWEGSPADAIFLLWSKSCCAWMVWDSALGTKEEQHHCDQRVPGLSANQRQQKRAHRRRRAI